MAKISTKGLSAKINVPAGKSFSNASRKMEVKKEIQ